MRPNKFTTAGMLGMFGELYGPTAPLDSLNLIQSLDIDKFLALLNRRDLPRKPPPPQKPGDIRRIDYTPLPTTQEILRAWVDEWLDSAKDKEGGEDPRDRNFDKAPGAALAAYEYSKQGKLHLLASGNSLSPWFETYNREPATGLETGLRLGRPQPEHYARQQLVFFLLSMVRFRLAKCRRDYCGTYFLLSHWNKRYKEGTRCKSCGRSRSEESALKATAAVRKWAKGELHDFAANKFAEQIRSSSDWHQQKELKDRIASFLNTKIARSDALRAVYKTELTGKWVAHPNNRKGIEKALKGGN